jgi:hypothetical protein
MIDNPEANSELETEATNNTKEDILQEDTTTQSPEESQSNAI